MSRLDQFRQKIAAESVNLEVAQALQGVTALPGRHHAKIATVAVVASAELMRDLETTVAVTSLKRAEWKSQITLQAIDLVLVESDYACLDDWRQDLVANGSDNQLVLLAQACRAAGIPCALWVTLQSEQSPLLAHLFDAFSHIFVADPKTYLTLKGSCGGKVKRMLPCVDIARFNPSMVSREVHGLPQNSMPVVTDCLASIMYHDPDGILLEHLQNVMEHKLWIYEGRDIVRPRESYVPAHVLRRSLGTLTRDSVGAVLKVSDTSIVLENEHRRSFWSSHRRIMEAMASKSLPISNSIETELLGELGPIAERFLCADTPEMLSQKLSELLNKRMLRERLQHNFFRAIATTHSVEVRVREMLEAVGSPTDLPSWNPLVSVILVTNRPENVPFALSCYRSQTYANKELILIVNTDDTVIEPLRRQIRDTDRARVIGVPAHWPIGVCLNAGISLAQGEYWTKFDDDDVYGANYIADYVLNASIVDFQIAGKAHVFTYDERTDRTVLRRSSDQPHTPTHALAGGSLFVRNRPDLVFNEAARGLVDIWFQWQHLAQGCLLYAVEPFNFLQVRRSDRRTHTWRIEVAEMGDAEIVGSGLALDAVFA